MTMTPAKIKQMAIDYAAAWSSKTPTAVASFYAEDGQIIINRGDVLKGRAAIAEMAGAFYDAFPDLVVRCDQVRTAGTHALFAWTLEGHHSETKNLVKLGGWEEWELNDQMQVISSLGWFDAEEEQRQIAGD
jgi:uncharacterized protein (TIGR02246 family)